MTSAGSRAGYALVVLAAVLWGSLGPVARVALEAGMQPLELAFWRAAVGGSCFALHAAVTRAGRVSRVDVPAVLAFAIVGVALFYGSYLQAVRTGGAALAAILLYTAPAWVAVGARVWLGERLGGRGAVALALTLAGVILVASGGSAVHAGAAGVAWGLAAGASYAAYYLFGKRFFARYAPSVVLASALLPGALLLAPAVSWTAFPARAWLAAAFIAVVPTYAAYLAYAHGLRRVSATRASLVATIEPVVAAVAAFVAWGESLTVAAYGGAALVIAGVVVATRASLATTTHDTHSRDSAAS